MTRSNSLKKYIYLITIFMMGLSGFAQMPIFKRYYIADIPGLGWLAEFYLTHTIHYISAIVLIAFTTYIFLNFILKKSNLKTITGSGYFKIVTLTGLIFTGALLVIRNLPGVYFDHRFIIAIDITHLSLCMILCAAGAYSLVLKKKWLR